MSDNANKPNPDELAALTAKYGEALHLLHSGPYTLAIRKPGRAEYQRFKSEADDPRKRTIAVENLVRGVLVWPSRAVLEGWLDQVPALCDDVSEPLLGLLGLSGKAALEKP